jgi:DNA repair protein RadC
VHRVPKYKVQLVRDGSVPFTTKICSTPRQAADLFRAFVGDSDREHLIAIFLDTQNRFLGLHTVSIGTLDHSVVHPREVFKAAILSNASSLVLAHNHPSGESAPSEEDVRITRELQKAGELLDIPLMDHIVVGEASYASFMELGLLDYDFPEPKSRRRRKVKEAETGVGIDGIWSGT